MNTEKTTIRARARSDGLRLLRTINHTQAHGEEGARADPTRAAHQAGLDVGSERYQDAMAYLVEQAALLGDAHDLRRRCWRPTPPRFRLLLLHQAGADRAGGMTASPEIFTRVCGSRQRVEKLHCEDSRVASHAVLGAWQGTERTGV